MTETFYRFHWADCPTFGAHNAWSALWGRKRSADGTKTRCEICDGTGEDVTDPATNEDGEVDFTCRQCEGTGWEDAARGYSCTRTTEALIDYFAERGNPGDADGMVVVFEGRSTGTGFDGETLAVPERITTQMTWTKFVKERA